MLWGAKMVGSSRFVIRSVFEGVAGCTRGGRSVRSMLRFGLCLRLGDAAAMTGDRISYVGVRDMLDDGVVGRDSRLRLMFNAQGGLLMYFVEAIARMYRLLKAVCVVVRK